MSLLEKLKAGKTVTKTFSFPGTAQEVVLTVLSNAEVQEALFATEAHFKKKEIAITLTTAEAYEDEQTTQLLALALRDPEDPAKPFAKGADELRNLLTTGEKDVLVQQYNDFTKEVSPTEKLLSAEEMDALFEDLKKNPETGNALSSVTLKRLIFYLASRQLN